ncbi:MAG: polymer-forming cytoskeletal protein [Candidatus Omnitrophota bacterium]
MARRKEEDKILDVSAAMQGSLVFSDPVNLRINGKFEGNLTTKGNLIIGTAANVHADISGESIVIAGIVKGKIKATVSIKLASTAQVSADIAAVKLSIEEGAVFNGSCSTYESRISLEDLSDYLSIEEDKIMEWVNSGTIPVEKENEKLVFDRGKVEDWIARKS